MSESLDFDSLQEISVAYATASAGMHPSHSLPAKLSAISQAGFKWTEIAFPDLESFISSRKTKYRKIDSNGEGDIDELLKATEEISNLCQRLELRVLTLMPFSRFEGYSNDYVMNHGLKRAETWFKVMKTLKCTMLQLGSSDDPHISHDFDLMVINLQTLADAAAKQRPPISIAYEMWAWGTYVNTWEHTWTICSHVSRPNFGLCLDTFQISAPYLTKTLSIESTNSSTAPPSSLEDSLHHLTETLKSHTDKIFYLQISDGRFVSKEILIHQANEQQIQPLYAYSNAYRPLPFQTRILGSEFGLVPVMKILRAVLATGWRGPWSYEVFFAEDQNRDDPDIPSRWANDAMNAHTRIIAEISE